MTTATIPTEQFAALAAVGVDSGDPVNHHPELERASVGRLPAPPFPIDCLPEGIAPWLERFAASKSAAPDYAALPLLVMAAGAIGASRSVRLRAGWEEPAIIWGMLVGAPAAHKSPPLLALKRVLSTIEREEAGDMETKRREYETTKVEAEAIRAAWEAETKQRAKEGHEPRTMPTEAMEPEAPEEPRLIVGDVTREKLASIHHKNPRGVVMVRDELAGLIGNFGRYGGEDASFYLSAHSGDIERVDRKTSGSTPATRSALSIVGGIQPERLVDLMLKRTNDGLVARFLVAWPDPVKRDWRPAPADDAFPAAIFRRLRLLSMDTGDDGQPLPRALPLTAEASEMFGHWWTKQGTKAAAASGFFADFIGKAPGACGRLALVIECLEWAADLNGSVDGPVSVSEDSVARAITLIDGYFEPMARRVYADALEPAGDAAAARLLQAIRVRGAEAIRDGGAPPSTLNERTVRREWGIEGLRSSEAVSVACAELVESGHLEPPAERREEEPNRPGPKAKNWTINPRIWSAIQ